MHCGSLNLNNDPKLFLYSAATRRGLEGTEDSAKTFKKLNQNAFNRSLEAIGNPKAQMGR